MALAGITFVLLLVAAVGFVFDVAVALELAVVAGFHSPKNPPPGIFPRTSGAWDKYPPAPPLAAVFALLLTTEEEVEAAVPVADGKGGTELVTAGALDVVLGFITGLALPETAAVGVPTAGTIVPLVAVLPLLTPPFTVLVTAPFALLNFLFM